MLFQKHSLFKRGARGGATKFFAPWKNPDSAPDADTALKIWNDTWQDTAIKHLLYPWVLHRWLKWWSWSRWYTTRFSFWHFQGDQLNITVFFWYLAKSDACTLQHSSLHWTSHVLQGISITQPFLTGHAVCTQNSTVIVFSIV